MELPGWMKLLRFLVITLLCVSILAMASLIWAAFRIVSAGLEGGDLPVALENMEVDLPDGAEPLSLGVLPDGKKIIIYQMNSEYSAQIIESNGEIAGKIDFQ